MATTNSIGEFNFLSLEGEPETLREEIELVTRPGVDGVALWKTGLRGRPFRLKSTVDSASMATGRALFASYAALVGDSPVALVWANINMDSLEAFKVAVLAVHPLRLVPVMVSAGGLNSPSGALLECVWDLIPIESV